MEPEPVECSPSSSRSNTPELSTFKPAPSGSQVTANKSKKASHQKSTNRMSWDNTSVGFLVGEVILRRPYQFKVKTADRARAWQLVAEGMQRRGYKVDARAARDRINALKEQVKAKNRTERAATGIAVEETEEEKKIREAVEEMIQEEEDIELAPKEKGDEERKKTEGEEIRKRACETFGETKKRHQGDCPTTPSRRRNSGRDTLAFLDRKMESELELKREELKRRREDEERRRAEEMQRRQEEQERRRAEEEKRRAEEETRERRFELMQQQMLQQQQQLFQQQQQMQQHNQQMQTMMMALIKAVDKKT